MIPLIDIHSINRLALEAGETIMEVYQLADFTQIIDYKSDDSPLTLADKKSNEVIVKGLQLLYPQIPIISEEGANIDYKDRKDWKNFWLVDPLDGTKEFIKRNGEFTVNIALIHEGLPVLGCIYIPASGILYFGSQGKGAYKMLGGTTYPIHVSNKTSDLTSVGSRTHSSETEKLFLSQFPIRHFVSAGSSLKFCLIADGSADIYYREGPTMEWDIAAGQAIVEAAGGQVLDPFKMPFRYNKLNLLNGSFICLGNALTQS